MHPLLRKTKVKHRLSAPPHSPLPAINPSSQNVMAYVFKSVILSYAGPNCEGREQATRILKHPKDIYVRRLQWNDVRLLLLHIG